MDKKHHMTVTSAAGAGAPVGPTGSTTGPTGAAAASATDAGPNGALADASVAAGPNGAAAGPTVAAAGPNGALAGASAAASGPTFPVRELAMAAMQDPNWPFSLPLAPPLEPLLNRGQDVRVPKSWSVADEDTGHGDGDGEGAGEDEYGPVRRMPRWQRFANRGKGLFAGAAVRREEYRTALADWRREKQAWLAIHERQHHESVTRLAAAEHLLEEAKRCQQVELKQALDAAAKAKSDAAEAQAKAHKDIHDVGIFPTNTPLAHLLLVCIRDCLGRCAPRRRPRSTGSKRSLRRSGPKAEPPTPQRHPKHKTSP